MCYKQILLTGIVVFSSIRFYSIKIFFGDIFGKMVKKIQGSDMKVNINFNFISLYVVLIFQVYYFVISKNCRYLIHFY